MNRTAFPSGAVIWTGTVPTVGRVVDWGCGAHRAWLAIHQNHCHSPDPLLDPKPEPLLDPKPEPELEPKPDPELDPNPDPNSTRIPTRNSIRILTRARESRKPESRARPETRAITGPETVAGSEAGSSATGRARAGRAAVDVGGGTGRRVKSALGVIVDKFPFVVVGLLPEDLDRFFLAEQADPHDRCTTERSPRCTEGAAAPGRSAGICSGCPASCSRSANSSETNQSHCLYWNTGTRTEAATGAGAKTTAGAGVSAANGRSGGAAVAERRSRASAEG